MSQFLNSNLFLSTLTNHGHLITYLHITAVSYINRHIIEANIANNGKPAIINDYFSPVRQNPRITSKFIVLLLLKPLNQSVRRVTTAPGVLE